MAKLVTFSFPVDAWDGIQDAFAAKAGWTQTIDDGEGNQVPNPVTKDDVVTNDVIDYVSQVWGAFAVKGQVVAARAAASAQVTARQVEVKAATSVTVQDA